MNARTVSAESWEGLEARIKSYWEQETCGTRYGESNEKATYYGEIEKKRYQLISFLRGFARFEEGCNRDLLEIGVGAGTDFHNWVRHKARAHGVDLTKAAIDMTRDRLSVFGEDLSQVSLQVADAGDLPFAFCSMDIVWSWGVLMHTPSMEVSLQEVFRVLRPGGVFKGMVYRVPSWTGWLLWTWHCLLRGRWFRSPRWAIHRYLESPGTKAYTDEEMLRMLRNAGFVDIRLERKLSPSDQLTIVPSSRYSTVAFKLISQLYPRWLVNMTGDRFGFNLLIEARRPSSLGV